MADTPYTSGHSQFDGFDAHARPDCLACEAAFTDALDERLTSTEQTLFDLHLASCAPCAGMYAEAQRGAAWLHLLKTPRPEPRPELLASILAQTSGNVPTQTLPLAPALCGPVILADPDRLPVPARLLAFPARPTAIHRLGRILLEPRLAMTAAMAFFSITLTMSLAGVHLNDLHASDLSPSSLRRSAHGMQAGAVRYYDNLRVVHVLESRVDDLRENIQQRRQDDLPAPEPATPAPGKPGKPESRIDGGSSSLRLQSPHTLPVLTSMVVLLNPWPLNGDRA